MRAMLAMLAALTAMAAHADIPANAQRHLPTLAKEIDTHWPELTPRSVVAGQVEMESCITLKHPRCWDTRAELKTSREYGFGLGQITIAYRADGSVRFNKFEELKREHAALKSWQWADRFDPAMQLRAMVLMDRRLFQQVTAATHEDRLAMMLSAYNGGMKGVMQDQGLCRSTPGCDAGRWFGHVELHSMKSRKKWNGYGRSAYEINRHYVRGILQSRRLKYVQALGT